MHILFKSSRPLEGNNLVREILQLQTNSSKSPSYLACFFPFPNTFHCFSELKSSQTDLLQSADSFSSLPASNLSNVSLNHFSSNCPSSSGLTSCFTEKISEKIICMQLRSSFSFSNLQTESALKQELHLHYLRPGKLKGNSRLASPQN